MLKGQPSSALRDRSATSPTPERDVSEEGLKERHGGPAHAPASPPHPPAPRPGDEPRYRARAPPRSLGRARPQRGGSGSGRRPRRRGGRGGTRGTYPAREEGGSLPRPCSSGARLRGGSGGLPSAPPSLTEGGARPGSEPGPRSPAARGGAAAAA